MTNKEIWLIGASQMAVDYANVLKALKKTFTVIGRGEESAIEFEGKIGVRPVTGGLEKWLAEQPALPTEAIVAVGVEQLNVVTESLIRAGVKRILLEKPGGMNAKEISATDQLAQKFNTEVYIAYNRRFFSSVRKGKEMIIADGGVISFHFEFTEWGHIVGELPTALSIKRTWFLSNSSHVIDMAFFLGGVPKKISCYSAGKTSWHKPTVFTGAGVAENNALFSYTANWLSPGRWSVEILTAKHRFIFRPLEKLQVQNIGSVNTDFVAIDDSLDTEFKPGLFLQTESFLNGNTENLCSIGNQVNAINNYYSKISKL